MKGAENTRKLLSEEIQPVSITDNYNAGWLSRDGTYYGMNGSYANMLHLSLADAIRKRMIVENGVDPLKGFPGKSMDTWLCEQGWVKIHDDHILYQYSLHQETTSAIKFQTVGGNSKVWKILP